MLTGISEVEWLSASIFGGHLLVSDEQHSSVGNSLELEVAAVHGVEYLRFHDAMAQFATPVTEPLSFTADNHHTLFIPRALITGSLQVQGGGGEDTLTVKLEAGNAIPAGGIYFYGDLPTVGSGDLLIIDGGSQGIVTYNYWNASDGNIELSNYGTISYMGLEPITNTGSATDVIFNLPPTTNSVSLADDGTVGNGLSRLSGGTFETTDFLNPSGSVTINRGSASDTLTTGALPDFHASLQLGSASSPWQTLTFENALTLGVNKSLAAFTSGPIRLPNSSSDVAVSGSGSISLTAASNIELQAGASLSSVNGALTLLANRQTAATVGNFIGIEIEGVVQSTGTGNVVVAGRGGLINDAAEMIGVSVHGAAARITSQHGSVQVTGDGGGTGAAVFSYGVQVAGGGQIAASGNGSVSVLGTGGSGGGADYGVLVTGTNSRIGAANGSVEVVGTAGNVGSSNHGVLVNQQATIAAGGPFSTNVTGFGGGSGESNFGVLVAGGNITSGGGPVTVAGTGGTGPTRNDGVAVSSAGKIFSSGLDLVSVTGQAIGTNRGVILEYSGSIENSEGSVTVATATLAVSSGGVLRSAAWLTLAADQMAIDNTAQIDAGTNSVFLKTHSPSQMIDLGGADSATTLGLTDAELDRVTAATLVFGNSDAAGLVVSSAITRTAPTYIMLRPGSPITFSTGTIWTNGGQLVINNPSFPLRPLTTGTDINASTLSFTNGSKLQIEIAGPTANTQYSLLSVPRNVNLTGAELVLTGSYTPTPTDSFVIVDNSQTFTTTGTFNGLAEGSIVTFNGVPLRLTYAGGSNANDVVLQPFNRPPSITSDGGGATASKTFFTGSSANVTTVTATDVDSPPSFSYSIAGGVDQSLFTIHPTTGALRFATPPSFNSPADANRDNVYEVQVQVADQLAGVDVQAITISVNNLIPVSGQRDLIYDATRQQLLVTSANGTLRRYDAATNTWLTPLTVGTSLNGGDITTDGNFAYVTEASITGGRKIYKVNLNTGAVTNLPYLESYSLELGSWDLAIASNNTALFTPLASNTSVKYFALRQIDLQTDVISETSHADIQSGVHLDRGADRSRILIRQPDWSSNSVSAYTPSGFTAAGSSDDVQGLAMAAVSPDGSQIAMEANLSVGLYDTTYRPKTYFELGAGGVIYHPTVNLMLAVDTVNNQLVATDLASLQEKYRLNIGEDVGSSTPLGAGVMAISADGKSVYLSTAAGIRLITLPSETGPAWSVNLESYSEHLAANVPTTIEVAIRNQAGNLATDYTGTVQFSSNDPAAILPAAYTFTPADAGKKTFTYSFSTKGNKSVTVSDSQEPMITATTEWMFVYDSPPSLLRLDGMQDMVFDSLRNVLYITTETGVIQRYDPVTDSILPPWDVGRYLHGADLSADHSSLYVTDSSNLMFTGLLRKVDLNSGGVTTLSYALDAGEGGGTDIGLTADGKALIGGYVDRFRRLDTATGTISVVQMPGRQFGTVGYNQLTPAADGSYVFIQDNYFYNELYTWSNGGAFSAILPSNDHSNELAAVNADGSLIAMELRYDIAIFDKNFHAVQQLPLSGGLIFHPTQPLLLVADEGTDQIIAFDTNTWEERYRIPIQENLFASRPLMEGEMEISADGSRLFLATSMGLRIYHLPMATGAATSITITEQTSSLSVGVESAFTVTVRDPAGNPVTNFAGTVHFSSTDASAILPADYTFTPGDHGQHTFNFRLVTAGTHTITVSDISAPLRTRTSLPIQVNATPPAFLPIPGAREFVFDSTRNVMYIIMAGGEVQRYSFTTNSLLSPWKISHSLAGGDINLDNTALYVHNSLTNVSEGVIHKIDLATGAVTNLFSPHLEEQTAAWDLKIAANGLAFGIVTESHFGDLSLQQINTATDVVAPGIHGYINAESHAARNSSRSLLAFVVSSSSAGDVFTYNGVTGEYSSVVRTNRGLGNAFLAVNDAGTAVAISGGNKLEIRTPSLGLVTSVTGTTGAVAFKPGTNLLFLADQLTDRIHVYNGDTGWNRITSIFIGQDIAPENLGEGTLAFTSDGSKLMLVTETGVRLFDIGDLTPPTVSGTPGSQALQEGVPSNALPFVVGDNQTPAADLVLLGRSSNSTRIPHENIMFGGSGANRTVTLIPDPDLTGSSTITVTVMDRFRNVTDFTFSASIAAINDPPTFVAGPNQSVPFGSGSQTVNGWATSIYEGAANEVSQSVLLQITGNTNSALFSTQPAVSATGVLTYTPAVGQFGTSTITVTPTDSSGAVGAPQSFVINVGSPNSLVVSSFAATATGFVAEFSQPIDHAVLHLHTSADIILQRAADSLPIRGSVVVEPGQRKLTFVATEGLLPPGSYSVRLRSASDGFRDLSLSLLDGDNNGLPGGDYVQTFTVLAPAPVVIRLPNIVRGPGQAINVPVSASTGIPISFSNGGGLTRVNFSLRYDAELLNLTGATIAPGLPLGSTVSITFPQPGLATIEFRSPEPLPEGTTRFVDLQAAVPSTAIYRQKQVIDIFNIDLGGVATGVDDDAMQVVAYFGDVTGNGTYSAQDASIVAQFAVGMVTGLAGYRLLDPLLIGDITGNGAFSSLDTSLMLQASVGLLINEIPGPLPAHTILQGGPDPKLSIPRNLAATAGQSLIIPVDIDSIVDLTGNGLESADLVIYYDPTVFEITAATLGRLVAQRGWILSSRIDSLAGRIDLSLAGTRALEGRFRGEFVQLQALVKENAPAGSSAINLAATSRSRATQLNEGFLTLIPAPTDAADDAIDGRVLIRPAVSGPASDTTATLIGQQLFITGSHGDDRILIGNTIDGKVRVRIGNRLLGEFDAPAGIAIDALTGDDFVFVAPLAPPTVIATSPSEHDFIFGGNNSAVLNNTLEFENPDSSAQSASRGRAEALLQLLAAWQAESEADGGLFPQRRTIRRLT